MTDKKELKHNKKPKAVKCIAKKVLFLKDKRVKRGTEFTCSPSHYEIFKSCGAV